MAVTALSVEITITAPGREKTSGAEPSGPATFHACKEEGLAMMTEKVQPER